MEGEHNIEDMELTLNSRPLDNHNPDDLQENQNNRSRSADPGRNEDITSKTSISSQAYIDHFEWTLNNLPIGISYDARSRISTPGFMKEWTDIPIKRENAEISITEVVNLLEPAVSSRLRRSPRNQLTPRVPFPSELPIWAILATDFRLISAIPHDARIWCPSCERTPAKENFGITPASKVPVETCLDCRKGQTKLPSNLAICWSAPSDHEGCGRLLPRSQFSRIYDRDTYTGIFCRDCRTFGHARARLEGRYNEAK